MPDDFTHQEEGAATHWVYKPLHPVMPVSMCLNMPYFIILLRLMPDDFTHQEEGAATHWVYKPLHPVMPVSMCLNMPYFIILLFYSV